ncbi:hypothetical protein VNO78_28626 [Psophocarpus tetragonolobus]|uniref:Uncharacterized protein n=1 Tax=Psophocarpus tetragonolobus TaxID=3891 RepID=A0AAN9RU14_PSOTE
MLGDSIVCVCVENRVETVKDDSPFQSSHSLAKFQLANGERDSVCVMCVQQSDCLDQKSIQEIVDHPASDCSVPESQDSCAGCGSSD